MPVSDIVDAESAEHVDEFFAVDVAENRAFIVPLDSGVIGAHRFAILEKSGVDVIRPILHRIRDYRLALLY